MLLSTNTVKADTTGTSKTSTATFSITAGKAGDLTLDQVPNFTFSETLDNLSDSVKGNADNPIIVSDARGTGAGWTLTAQLGNFNNESGSGWYLGIGNDTVSYGGGTDSKQIGDAPKAGNNSTTLNAGGAAVPMLSADAGSGIGTWDDTVNDPTLTTGSVVPATLTTKTATMTWNLNDTSTTDSATK